jgi:WD40 repeat protein
VWCGASCAHRDDVMRRTGVAEQSALECCSGPWLASAVFASNVIVVWHMGLREMYYRFDCHRDAVMCIKFIPELSLFATASLDKTVRLFSLTNDTFAESGLLTGHSGGVRQVGMHVPP